MPLFNQEPNFDPWKSAIEGVAHGMPDFPLPPEDRKLLHREGRERRRAHESQLADLAHFSITHSADRRSPRHRVGS